MNDSLKNSNLYYIKRDKNKADISINFELRVETYISFVAKLTVFPAGVAVKVISLIAGAVSFQVPRSSTLSDHKLANAKKDNERFSGSAGYIIEII